MPEKFKPRDYESYDALPEEEKENFKKVDDGFVKKEALDLEEARKDAAQMQNKVAKGETKDYNEAEKIIDDEKRVDKKEVEISLKEFLVYDNPKKEEYQKLIKEVERENLIGNWGYENIQASWADTWKDLLENLEEIEDSIDKIEERINRIKEGRASQYLNKKIYEVMLDDENKEKLEIEEKAKPYREEISVFKEKLKDGILIDLGGGGTQTMARFARISGSSSYINVEKYREQNNETDPHMDIAKEWEKKEYPSMQYMVVKDDMLDFISKLPDNSANFTINGINYQIIENQKYHKALAQELVRATKEGGIIFGVQSDVFNYLSGEEFKDKVREIEKGRTERIFEKMKIEGNKKTNHETE